MSMKTTTSRPLTVADIQRALRPGVYASKRTAASAGSGGLASSRSAAAIEISPGASPAPQLADMLDQARVHTAVLRTLLADAVSEEDAARARIDDTRKRADALAPALERSAAAGTAAASHAKTLSDAADRAAGVADRLARLIAAAESLADDLTARQAAEFDRQLAAFSGALAERAARTLAEIDARLATLGEHAKDLPPAIRYLEGLLGEARRASAAAASFPPGR